MLKSRIVAITASALALMLTLSTVFAAPGEQTEASPPFQFLITVLTDANDKGALPDSTSGLLSDLFIEDLISPQTGETPEQVRERLSAEGQSTFQFLIAALTDANDRRALSDDISDLLSDWFIENLIAPHTGETPEQARQRLSVPSETQTLDNDRAALVALYNATDGPNWRNKTNWLSDRPLDEWYGIDTDSDGRITRIDLPFNRLTGPIPPQLGDLSNLTWLVLGDNRMSGPIPPQLGNLSNLEILWLSHNQLSGPIPPQLGNLSNLEILWLLGNNLSGEIPSELGRLYKLTELRLSENELSGEIPSELGKLSNLTLLELGVTELSGEIPPELGSLYNLTKLSLGSTELSGEMPSELGKLSNLTQLELGDNGLSGEIPPELSRLPNLERLDLGDNELSGEIPPELGDLSNLRWLYLGGNQLSGCVPASLRDVQKNYLGYLGLSFCDGAPAPTPRYSIIVTMPAPYYTQFIFVEGITIKASDRVRSVSMYNAAEVIETMMTSLRSDIQECLISAGASLAIAPLGEYITALPEFASQEGELDFVTGLGAVKGQPTSGVVEFTLLGIPYIPEFVSEFIFEFIPHVAFHEFAHAAQNLCFTEDQHEEWNRLYSEAQQANLFPGAYGMTNSDEFFAEFSVSYFQQPYAIQWHWAIDEELTRQKLSTDLPEIFDFLERIYPGFELGPDAAPASTLGTSYSYRVGDRGSWIHR